MISYIETHIVEHCNLKCKGCSHFSGIAPPKFKDLKNFEEEFKALSELTNKNIPIIRIMGGEPLLHKDVVSFCLTAREYFPNSSIVLVSNGILLPQLSDTQIDTLNKHNIQLCISNYGLKLNFDQLNKFKTHYFHAKNDMYNISLDLQGAQSIEQAFQNCDLVRGQWYFFKDWRIYQCCIMANIDYFINHFSVELPYDLDDVSIDIRNHSLEEIEQFLHTPHKACAYCNTIARHHSYAPFSVSKGDIKEWTI